MRREAREAFGQGQQLGADVRCSRVLCEGADFSGKGAIVFRSRLNVAQNND